MLEPLYGALRVSGVFAIGVVSGSLVQAVFNHAYALLGSSAGVYALMVSLVPNVFLVSNIITIANMQINCFFCLELAGTVAW